jgi:hypothetical protein
MEVQDNPDPVTGKVADYLVQFGEIIFRIFSLVGKGTSQVNNSPS